MSDRVVPTTTSQTGPSPSSSRPRLPAALLARTNSQQGAAPSSATSSVASPSSAGGDSNTDTLTEKLASATIEDDKKAADGTPTIVLDKGEKFSGDEGAENIETFKHLAPDESDERMSNLPLLACV